MPKEQILHEEDKRFLENLHSKYWKNFKEISSDSQLSKDDKEFHLHLYDKLWENVTNKENRLWTFLTFYGAVIGIVLGASGSGTLNFEIGAVLLILTYWASEITISAEWWSVRNRLMIRGIERRAYEATKGVIPSVYQSPRYSSESLHISSLLILTLLGIFIFALSIGFFNINQMQDNWFELSKALLLYVFLVIVLGKFAHTREGLICRYYRLYRDLSNQENEIEVITSVTLPHFIDSREKDDKRNLSWRGIILFFYFIITMIFIFKHLNLLSNFKDVKLLIIFQLILLIIFIIQWVRYKIDSKLYGFSILFLDGENKFFKFTNFLLFCSFLGIPFVLFYQTCLLYIANTS